MKEIAKFNGDGEIKTIVRTGGYYKWDWIFPFRHFVKEEIIVATSTKLYKLTKDK